jgi:hypothetical protein
MSKELTKVALKTAKVVYYAVKGTGEIVSRTATKTKKFYQEHPKAKIPSAIIGAVAGIGLAGTGINKIGEFITPKPTVCVVETDWNSKRNDSIKKINEGQKNIDVPKGDISGQQLQPILKELQRSINEGGNFTIISNQSFAKIIAIVDEAKILGVDSKRALYTFFYESITKGIPGNPNEFRYQLNQLTENLRQKEFTQLESQNCKPSEQLSIIRAENPSDKNKNGQVVKSIFDGESHGRKFGSKGTTYYRDEFGGKAKNTTKTILEPKITPELEDARLLLGLELAVETEMNMSVENLRLILNTLDDIRQTNKYQQNITDIDKLKAKKIQQLPLLLEKIKYDPIRAREFWELLAKISLVVGVGSLGFAVIKNRESISNRQFALRMQRNLIEGIDPNDTTVAGIIKQKLLEVVNNARRTESRLQTQIVKVGRIPVGKDEDGRMEYATKEQITGNPVVLAKFIHHIASTRPGVYNAYMIELNNISPELA